MTPLPHEPSPICGTIEDTELQLYNWHGFRIVVGAGYNTSILDEIQYRRRNVKQNMMLIAGPPGEGKSYFALRLAQILDPKFEPSKQIVFERTHLLWLIGAKSPLKMGQVIVVDEAQFIAGARRWYEDIQKDVMEHIESIRSKGFIVLIVALHINLLDKIIRNYVLSHMAKLNQRGRATIYHLWTPTFADKLFKQRMGHLALQLPDVEQCAYANCLVCRYMNQCMTLRAVYERLKREFLSKMSAESRQKAELKERRKRVFDLNSVISQVVAKSDELVFAKNGNVELESVKLIMERNYGMTLADSEARRIVKRGMILHSNIFKKVVKKDETI